MNTPPDNLSEVLRGWRVNPPVDPNFRHAVWQRIGHPAGVSWPSYLRAHTAAWALVALVTLSTAGYAGRALARTHARTDRETMVVTYLVELDPRVQAILKP
jgi:hypothetical protein